MKKDNFFTHKFLPVVAVILFIVNIFLNNTVFGATYDLKDYKNHDLKNGGWAIIRVFEDNTIYLITTNNASYPYMYAGYTTDSQGNIFLEGGILFNRNIPYSNQSIAGIYVYTFNTETSKFENPVGYNWEPMFTVKKAEVIASGCDIRVNDGTSFFQPTPVPSRVYINPTLTEIITKGLVEMVAKLVENMKTIILIGLAVLSIGLLIYVIKSVISHMT